MASITNPNHQPLTADVADYNSRLSMLEYQSSLDAKLEALESITDSFAWMQAYLSVLDSARDDYQTSTPAGRAGATAVPTKRATAVPTKRTTVVPTKRTTTVPTKRTTDTALTSGERAGPQAMGYTELAIDIGILVFLFVVALIWLRAKNWLRNRDRGRRLRREEQQQQQQQQQLEVQVFEEPGWMKQGVEEVKEIGTQMRQIARHDYTRIILRDCFKVVVGVGLLWGGYRVVWFFAKDEWERENDVDFVVSLGLHVLCALFCVITFLGVGSTIVRTWVVRHDNGIQVGDLDSTSIGYQHGFDIHGTKILNDPRVHQEARMAVGKQEDLQKASTLPSGRQFSPVPLAPPPRRLTAFDRLYNSAAGGVRYSGSRCRNPGKASERRQHIFNSFEANLFFMTPIDEDKEMTALRTKKRDEIWRRIPDGVKPEVRRLLWPTCSAQNINTETPFKRFL
ncbi:MAG: hypothetical protein L6R40_003061 [Gallowayella cf. fulva]|nr:MAG: hypothetical protein L6R40_003061 [Xanthomendoza cf. fulva]